MNKIPSSYNGKPLIHSWNYCAKDGAPFGVVGRYQDGNGKKDIVPFFKRNGSSFAVGIELNPRPLFGLDKLAAQPKDKAVFIVEGEKSAAALHSIGVCALTSLGGSQAASKADWLPLDGYKTAYLLPDNDEPGLHYVRDVYAALMTLESPPAVKVLHLSGLPAAGDVVDWLQNHAPDWEGLQPFPEDSKKWVRSELQTELKNAEDVPEDWTFVGFVSSHPSVFDWEIPGEIETKTPPVQALPPEMIPAPFRPWLADVSHRMQTPPDFVTVSAIVVTASVIGAGCSIKPKKFDDWEIVPNLWGAVIAPPSKKKTPTMSEATGLLDRLQAEYAEQFEKDKTGAEFDMLANKAMVDDVKAQLSKAAKGKGKDGVAKGDDLQKLKADYLELTEKAEPEATRRLFKTNETSVQSMTVLQKQNARGLLVERDELTGLLAKWETEQGQEERTYFLHGWNGNGRYTDFKIGRGLTEAPSICISLLGGIQPDKLKRYLYQAMNGLNDGLMQRLQLAVWPDMPKQWEYIDKPFNKADKERAYSVIKMLAELDFIQYGAKQGDYDNRPYFRFDDAGLAVFIEWFTNLEAVKLPTEENPLMVEHLSKFGKLMPSLALIFHCIDIADGKSRGDVSAQSAQLAVDWCKYLESHARRIYAMAESPEYEAAVRLAGKIKAKALPDSFTSRDVERKGWHGLKDKQEIESACNILIDENWLMMHRKPKPVTGRPPLPEYYINPVFL
ncbi:MAG: DUF3987 domain-containing protein [Methylococcaceae bacterium]|nr:DUF3987 domain-containing protein [Methylococcaceae bacterium]